MLRVTGFRVRLEDDTGDNRVRLAGYLGVAPADIESVEIVRRSLDARKQSGFWFVHTLNVGLRPDVEKSPAVMGLTFVSVLEEQGPAALPMLSGPPSPRPVVIGMGPAGLFAALTLAASGARPIVMERGAEVGKRVRDTNAFWEGRGLNTESNVQFGEGGAGAFSDGKLTTRINDHRVRTVLKTLVELGAPAEILSESKPHVGTDRLRAVILMFRRKLAGLEADIRFNSRVDGLVIKDGRMAGVKTAGEIIEAGLVILAPGNAARDTFRMLKEQGVKVGPKPFAMGVRVEHPRELIDRIQYGRYAGHAKLGAADYMLTYSDKPTGKAAYTFCMCPGGRVIAAASEEDGVVVNGMSDYRRDAHNSNSALVVTVGPEDFGSDDPLGGVEFQRKWERAAYRLGGGGHTAPAQDMEGFLAGRAGGGLGIASYRPGVSPAELSGCLPAAVNEVLKRAIPAFDSRMKGFIHRGSVLTGVETRTSSPVRITRGDDFQSVSVRGLFPCGEGSGYAGGIVSSAVDGIKAAEKVIEELLAYDRLSD